MTDYNFKPKKTRDDFGWYNLEHLPHFDAPEQAQFITFRLCDSLPLAVVARLRDEASEELGFRKSVERYLDSGFGNCWLRHPTIAAVVRDAIKHGANKMYDLMAWVIMPNHVHVLLRPLPDIHLHDVLHSIKSYSAQIANSALGRSGQFWQHESFDRYIRDRKHLVAVVRYIELNPVKAGLCAKPEEWIFGSAYERLINENGKQGCLPSSQR